MSGKKFVNLKHMLENISCGQKTDEDLGIRIIIVCAEELGPQLLKHPSYYVFFRKKEKNNNNVETRFLREDGLRMGNSQLSSMMCIHLHMW